MVLFIPALEKAGAVHFSQHKSSHIECKAAQVLTVPFERSAGT